MVAHFKTPKVLDIPSAELVKVVGRMVSGITKYNTCHTFIRKKVVVLTKAQALPHPDAKVEHDHEIVASYEYVKNKKMMVTYDTPEIAAHKVDYIMQTGLGGAMWWESSADKTGGESIIRTVSIGDCAMAQSEACCSSRY